MKLELGTGARPTPGYQHHDITKHSPWIDVAFDLETLPWPVEDGSLEEIKAFDVFEHLKPWKVEIREWLDECYRVLEVGGLLHLRLPAWDNPYTWRDPTHYRGYHPELFYYWTPSLELAGRSSVWKNFGRYYFGPEYSKWWHHVSVDRDKDAHGDLLFVLKKRIYTPQELEKAAK